MGRRGSERKYLFWTSYSDLMTSLFFIFLVLFIVGIIVIGRSGDSVSIKRENSELRKKVSELEDKIVVQEKEFDKIKEIENSIQNIDKTWFEYNEDHKKHILKIDVSFPKYESAIRMIPLSKREELYKAGLAIKEFLKNAEKEYGESVKYLLIIEGQASKDGWGGNFNLSYQRALNFYRYLRDEKDLELKHCNCEVLICGSGEEGVLRDTPDIRDNKNNQRFLIHILPKPGILK